jgi:hypothetical protein
MPVLTAAVGLEALVPLTKTRTIKREFGIEEEESYVDWSTAKSADIYTDIVAGEDANEWTIFQLQIANQLRELYGRFIQTAQVGFTDGVGGGCDVFRGAHLVLNDDAQWFYYWADCLDGHRDRGYRRWSSHYDKGKDSPKGQRYPENPDPVELQFEIYFPYSSRGRNWGCLLFGRYQKRNSQGIYVTENRTWFQTEAHASTRQGYGQGTSDFVMHGADFLCYWSTGKTQNVGPCGYSVYTEKTPLMCDEGVPEPPLTYSDGAVKQLWNGEILPVSELGPVVDVATRCCKCTAVHNIGKSYINHWHRCTTCGAIYCPKCGGALQRTGAWSEIRIRKCDRPLCPGKTELVFQV